jgi:hypothetical protein
MQSSKRSGNALRRNRKNDQIDLFGQRSQIGVASDAVDGIGFGIDRVQAALVAEGAHAAENAEVAAADGRRRSDHRHGLRIGHGIERPADAGCIDGRPGNRLPVAQNDQRIHRLDSAVRQDNQRVDVHFGDFRFIERQAGQSRQHVRQTIRIDDRLAAERTQKLAARGFLRASPAPENRSTGAMRKDTSSHASARTPAQSEHDAGAELRIAELFRRPKARVRQTCGLIATHGFPSSRVRRARPRFHTKRPADSSSRAEIATADQTSRSGSSGRGAAPRRLKHGR